MKIKNVVCSILILLLCNSKEAASEPPGDDFISFQSHGKDNVTDNRMGARRNEIGVSRRFEELRQRANFGFNPLMSNASRNMEYLHKGRFSTAVSKGFEEDYDEDYLATESKSNIGQNIHSKGGEAKDKAFTRNFYLDVLLHSKIRLLNLKRQSEGKHPIDVERTPIHGGSAGNRIGVSIKVTMLIPDSKNIDFPYIINSPGGEPEDAPVLDKVYYGDLDKNMETILEGIETAADAAEPRLGARQDWLPKKRWKLHQRVALANYWDEQKREEKIEKRLRAIMNGERVPEAVFESHSYDHGMPTYFSSEEELLKAEAKYAAKAWNDGEWQCWAFLANRHDMRMEKLEKQKLKSGIRGSAMEDVGAGDASHEGTAAIHDVSYSALDERVDQISNEYPQGTVSGEGEILSSHPFQVRATQWGIPFISEGEAKKYGYAP